MRRDGGGRRIRAEVVVVVWLCDDLNLGKVSMKGWVEEEGGGLHIENPLTAAYSVDHTSRCVYRNTYSYFGCTAASHI